MIGVLIGVAAVLVLITLIMIFRVQSLVGILRGSDREPGEGATNKVNAALFIIFLVTGCALFFWYTFTQDYALPEAASEHGATTDFLFVVTMYIVGAAFIFTHILLFYFAFKYQHKKGNKAKFYPENNKLELAWTIIPAIVLTFLVFTGWRAWSNIMEPVDPASDVVELEIMGQQFIWQVRYPGEDDKFGKHDYRKIDGTNQFGIVYDDASLNGLDDFMPEEIHVPKGREVLFRIRAKDVLHSVYAPHFRLKMDAVPGMPTTFKFTPTITTEEMRQKLSVKKEWQEVIDDEGTKKWEAFNYELACAEICGPGHNGMRYVIVVDEWNEYLKWKKEQKPFALTQTDYVKEQIPEDLMPEFNKKMNELKKMYGVEVTAEAEETPAVESEEEATEEVETETTSEEEMTEAGVVEGSAETESI